MRYRLATSREGIEKDFTLAPGERRELCRLEGSGRIVRLWVTLPVFGQPRALKQLVLRAFWDGEAAPSIEVPLGDFFGAAFGRPRALISQALVVAGGGYLCHLEMPFNADARLELTNQGASAARHLFFQVGWYEEPLRAAGLPTLHAQYRQQWPTEPDEPVVVLKASGAGRLAGLRLDLQGQAWWLKPPLRAMALPRGFGLGLLEGWERRWWSTETKPGR